MRKTNAGPLAEVIAVTLEKMTDKERENVEEELVIMAEFIDHLKHQAFLPYVEAFLKTGQPDDLLMTVEDVAELSTYVFADVTKIIESGGNTFITFVKVGARNVSSINNIPVRAGIKIKKGPCILIHKKTINGVAYTDLDVAVLNRIFTRALMTLKG
jgi:hypothetical protein